MDRRSIQESGLCLGSGVFIGYCGLVQNKDRVQVSFVSHSLLEAQGLGIKVLGVSGLSKRLRPLHHFTP